MNEPESERHFLKMGPDQYNRIKDKMKMLFDSENMGTLDAFGFLKLLTIEMEEHLGVTESQHGHIDHDGEVHITREKKP